MPKPGQVEEQTLDEILASIRRIMDEDTAGDPDGAPTNGGPGDASTGNVSRLFADRNPSPRKDGGVSGEGDNIVELAMSQAMEDARAEVAARADGGEAELRAPEEQPDYAPLSSPQAHAVPVERKSTRPSLSPQAEAGAPGGFNQLTAGVLSGSPRAIDGLVEEMLRPMLRQWLDLNLPTLVERLVREEIERVSRGRR